LQNLENRPKSISNKRDTRPRTMPSRCVTLDLSIFRARPGSGRAEKNSVISGRNNPAHDHPTGRIRPQFSGRARAGPGLGRAARVFYSVKQIKTTFRAGHGPKKFAGFKISAHARPVRFVGGPGAGRVGPGSKCSGICHADPATGTRTPRPRGAQQSVRRTLVPCA
jgi:hypothetical protein